VGIVGNVGNVGNVINVINVINVANVINVGIEWPTTRMDLGRGLGSCQGHLLGAHRRRQAKPGSYPCRIPVAIQQSRPCS
jgi:hypothetical protein